jgi:hypothetical protein
VSISSRFCSASSADISEISESFVKPSEFKDVPSLSPDPFVSIHLSCSGDFYYVRRSLITLDEVKEHLRAICANEEFRSAKDQIGNKNAALIIEAQRYLSRNSILKNLRNYMGAHIDSAVVRSSIKYFGPDAVSRIRWVDDKTDFALRFDFATDLLKGAIASKLPRGIEHLEEEMPGFFQVLTEAFKYLQHATFILVHAFLWDRFGTA